ncbi:MAG: histidine phosphatase family protein [Oscillospiraceae bacterium]
MSRLRQGDKCEITFNFIRSGLTVSGRQGKLLGAIGEFLLPEEAERLERRREEGVYPQVSRVFTDSMPDSRQTASLIYPRLPAIVEPELDPFDYGESTGRRYQDVAGERRFQQSDGSEFPVSDAEETYIFQARTGKAFRDMLAEIGATRITEVAVIAHRENILAILRRYVVPRAFYLNPALEYGGGISLIYDMEQEAARIVNFF